MHVHSKDKSENKVQCTCGPIYYIKCQGKGDQEFEYDYIGETERTLKAIF